MALWAPFHQHPSTEKLKKSGGKSSAKEGRALRSSSYLGILTASREIPWIGKLFSFSLWASSRHDCLWIIVSQDFKWDLGMLLLCFSLFSVLERKFWVYAVQASTKIVSFSCFGRPVGNRSLSLPNCWRGSYTPLPAVKLYISAIVQFIQWICDCPTAPSSWILTH